MTHSKAIQGRVPLFVYHSALALGELSFLPISPSCLIVSARRPCISYTSLDTVTVDATNSVVQHLCWPFETWRRVFILSACILRSQVGYIFLLPLREL